MTGILDTEIEALIRILEGKTEVDIPIGLDAERLVELARKHRVTYPVLQFVRRHEGLFPDQQRQRLEEHARQNAVRSLMQLHELIRMARELNSKGISYACIKGPQLSRMLYGREALKESVDLDLMLLNRSDFNEIHQCLKEMGYLQSNLNDYRTRAAQKMFLLAKREVHYFNAGKDCHLDLHVRAAANAYLTIERYSRFFRELTTYDLEGTPVPILHAAKYLNFLCHHGAMHQFSSLGWLMDVRYFIRKMGKELDFTKVNQIARGNRTERSLYVSLLLLHELFGDELPVPMPLQGKSGRNIRYLASACRRRWAMDAAVALSFRGRMSRILYLMVLSEGLAAKADLIIGILIRSLLPVLRWRLVQHIPTPSQ